MQKKMSLLTGLNVSSLPCSSRFLLLYCFVYCFELNIEGLGM